MSHRLKAVNDDLDLQNDTKLCNGRRLAKTTGSVAQITYMLLFGLLAHSYEYHVAIFDIVNY